MIDQAVEEEIDDLTYFGFDSSPTNDDPFAKVSYSSLSPKMKRKVSKLAKKFEGIDGEIGRAHV